MKVLRFSLIVFMIISIFCVFSTQGLAQPVFGPLGLPWTRYPFYNPLIPFSGFGPPFFNVIPSFYNGLGWGYPARPLNSPMTNLLSPLRRAPNATIIFTSPTLTAVSTAPGVFIIGATGVVGAPTAVVPSALALSANALPLTPLNPAPAPLFSIIAVLYASALLDGKALLSTANPLLFAYLSSLIL